MAQITDGFLRLDRVTLHVREIGTGSPIILMHGITANAAIWDPVIQGLEDVGHVISISQRGHGQSDKPKVSADSYKSTAYATDVIELIEFLAAGKAILVGHSLGARNALAIAALRPDLVAAVIAVDFTPFIEAEVFDSLSVRVEGGNQTFDDVAALRAYVEDRYPMMPEDAVTRRVEHGYELTRNGLIARASPEALTATVEGLREPLEAVVSSIRVPTLFIRGMQSNLVTSGAFVMTKQLRPDLDYAEVPGTDHYVPEENPGAITAFIRLIAHRSRNSMADNA